MIKALALALSLPSTMIGLAYGGYILVREGIFSKGVVVGVFIGVISYTIFMIAYYAYKRKS